MKFELLYLKGQSEPWVDLAAEDYVRKISHVYPIERVAIKSRNSEREKKDEKIKAEAEATLKLLKPRDHVILFDEGGKKFDSSVAFSHYLQKIMGLQKNKLVFVVGGPYGVDKRVKEKADAIISLSSLTMSHHVAHVVVLEQIYRALAIWRGLPYHNP